MISLDGGKVYILTAILGFFVMIGTVWASADISVESAYIREAPPGQKVTAAFLTLANHSNKSCTLSGVATPIAGRAEIHGHFHKNGMMQMRPVAELALPAGETLALQPGGHHIMLFDLVEGISVGEHYPLTLYFEECPTLDVKAELRSPLQS